MQDILSLDVAGLVSAYRDRKLSPRDAVGAALDAIERVNGAVNAFCLVDREGALKEAAASEKRWAKGNPAGPLDGVPFTVKDNVIWQGHPTRRGSRTTDETPSAENAPAVDRLLEAGAIPVGKTTLPEFGWKGLGDSPLYGLIRNPWDTRMTTGGSSGGAGAAAALGLGPLHIGTDGAGSIRIPASFCGVFGIKPSFGRVPAYPPSPFAIVSHVGPMTRSVADAAIMLGTIAAPDPRDMTALVTPPQDYLAGLELGVRGLRVAWSPRLGYVETLDPEVEAITARAARVFEELGARVEEADPGFADPIGILETLWHVGAWSVLRGIPEARWAELDPGFVAVAEKGRSVLGADFVTAMNARGALYLAMERFHERYDLLLTPTLATPPFEVGNNTPPDGRFGENWIDWAPYSFPFNLTLQPAATVPCGFTASGLPVGLQIVGAVQRDGQVLRAARAFETARPWPTLTEPRVTHG
ncbi:amidase [Enterovirga aerilata]|uniref:Amidase n=1 Tax=Enterovirga aerilata TaxID=2730920 RepID=A0A849I7L1_9HYPH|nr:amidase [Enterovirga sp. DB1703]NNM73281.1 amidase [Enterovirga sp. DB1703]